MKMILRAVLILLLGATLASCAAFAGPSPLDLGPLDIEGSRFVIDLPLNTPWCKTATGGNGNYFWTVVSGQVVLDDPRGITRCMKATAKGKFEVRVTSKRNGVTEAVSLFGATVP